MQTKWRKHLSYIYITQSNKKNPLSKYLKNDRCIAAVVKQCHQFKSMAFVILKAGVIYQASVTAG